MRMRMRMRMWTWMRDLLDLELSLVDLVLRHRYAWSRLYLGFHGNSVMLIALWESKWVW